MAVAHWIPAGSHGLAGAHDDGAYGPRNFHPPKRSDLRYWYKDARKVLHNRIPEWSECYRAHVTFIEDRTIIFELGDGTLFIARKDTIR